MKDILQWAIIQKKRNNFRGGIVSIILDIVLIVIFVAFILVAAKKGFAKTLLELVAVVAALVLSYQLSPIAAQTTYDSLLKQKMISSIETRIDEKIESSTVAQKAEATLDAIPDFVVSLASSAGVEIDSIKSKIATEKFISENVAAELVEKVAAPIVVSALTILFFMILSMIFIFAFKFLAHLISKIFDVPLVGTANKVLGGILGACKGVIVIVFISTVLNFLFANSEGEFADAVNNSFVIGLLDNINPFVESLKNMLK